MQRFIAVQSFAFCEPGEELLTGLEEFYAISNERERVRGGSR